MDIKRWTSLNAIIDEALELPQNERISFIQSYNGLSEDLRREATSFLTSIQKSDSFWDTLLKSSSELMEQIDSRYPSAKPGMELKESPVIPDQIGPYKILDKLASGGMGNVYLAERTDGHLQITVALKLIRRECIDSYHIHQFNIERNVLGRLNHPLIARIYDGGIIENGQPYLVMEYVEGVPVTEYCKSHHCSIDNKLKLFEQICEGVNFAHTNLVVHRDLKPDNIFVKNNGNCKILDFGIAKIIQSEDDTEQSDYENGLKPFSILHAAPEQLTGGDITTSTDVYSLGLLLYELLTESLPFDLKQKTPSEAAETIRTTPLPIASSSAVNKLDASIIRGDLDDIVQKALQPDPDNRYQSAGELLADIRHFRHDLPLSFKQSQKVYKLKKFTTRNSALLSGISAAILLISALTAYYIFTIQSERQKAIANEEQATFIAGFMVDLFDASDPLYNINDTLTVYDILKSGRDKLENWEGTDISKADIMLSLGSAYKRIGDYEQSRVLLQDAYNIYNSNAQDSISAEMLKPIVELASLYSEERNFMHAAHFYDQSLQILEKETVPPDLVSTIYSKYGNTLSEIGNPQLAIIYLEKAVRVIGSENLPSSYLRNVQTNLAQAYRSNGEYSESENLYREVLDNTPTESRNSHQAGAIYNNLGYLMKVQNRYDEAITYYNRSLEINSFIFGEVHPNTRIVMNNLSSVYTSAGNYSKAEEIRLNLLQITRQEFGENHWRTGSAYQALGILKLQSDQLKDAPGYFKIAHKKFSDVLGKDHIWTERAMLYYSLSRLNSEESQLARQQFFQAFNSLKEKRITFSYYDVEMMKNLVDNFERYPSISKSPDFALLKDID